ncbi:MAG: ATP-binding cassette domain-containing protein [Pseudonocardiaceae bacterium]|nr:ATP-binding cassette domain-containing protein [Pseudonocardiaceae bacterium]
MIRFDAVTKKFAESAEPAVHELSLDVAEGEIVVLVGPSGCGKTTTLRMINRLIEPTSGKITVNGVDISTTPAHVLRRGIGYVIQQVGLFPHHTIHQNIAAVPDLLGWGRDDVQRRVTELLTLVGLDPDWGTRYPAELSGGQRQRVGVARALAADPAVLLMDEPFGAVDPIVRARLQRELLALHRQVRKTIVFVTHDMDEALLLGHRVAVFNTGGVLEQLATPVELLASPANDFVASFLGDDRALKRLALLGIAEDTLARGPAVQAGEGTDAARKVMREHGTEWAVVLDGERLRGRIDLPALRDGHPVGEQELRPVETMVRRDGNLRGALDAIVSSPDRMVVVLGADDVYLGMLTLEGLTAELAG